MFGRWWLWIGVLIGVFLVCLGWGLHLVVGASLYWVVPFLCIAASYLLVVIVVFRPMEEIRYG